MVYVRNIKSSVFRKYFSTKKEAIAIARENKIKSFRGETEEDFIKRLLIKAPTPAPKKEKEEKKNYFITTYDKNDIPVHSVVTNKKDADFFNKYKAGERLLNDVNVWVDNGDLKEGNKVITNLLKDKTLTSDDKKFLKIYKKNMIDKFSKAPNIDNNKFYINGRVGVVKNKDDIHFINNVDMDKYRNLYEAVDWINKDTRNVNKRFEMFKNDKDRPEVARIARILQEGFIDYYHPEINAPKGLSQSDNPKPLKQPVNAPKGLSQSDNPKPLKQPVNVTNYKEVSTNINGKKVTGKLQEGDYYNYFNEHKDDKYGNKTFLELANSFNMDGRALSSFATRERDRVPNFREFAKLYRYAFIN